MALPNTKKLAVVLATLCACAGAQAAAILTQASSTGYGLNTSNMTSMRAALGVSNTVTQTSAFNNAGYMDGFDALWVNDQFTAMSSSDMDNITNFLRKGHKAVFITDNSGWAAWNNSIETMLGASIQDTCAGSNGVALVSNALSKNAPQLFGNSCNSLIVQTPNATMLYGNNMAALYKVGSGEALLITSVDIVGNALYASNKAFAENVAAWEAAPIPVPGTLALLALGLPALLASRGKKAA
jgi:hypothetical protein